MRNEIGLDELDGPAAGPAGPIPWEGFRLAVEEAWSGPPHCCPAYARQMRWTLDTVESINLAREGEEPRTIRTTADLTIGLVGRFMRGRPAGLSPFTIKSNLSLLRTLCCFAFDQRWLAVNPFVLRKMSRLVRPGRPRGKRHLSSQEICKILDEMKATIDRKEGWAKWRARRIFALTSTVAYVGLRAMEAQCLWVSDVDLASGVIDLVPHGTRLPAAVAAGDEPRFKTSSSAQPVVMPRALIGILEEWMVHRLEHPADFTIPPPERIPWMFPGVYRVCPWTGGGNGTAKPMDHLKAAAKRAGVEGASFQALRRSWTTRAEAVGIPQALITRQCRHTDEATTKRWYQQRDMDALKSAVEGFDFS